MHGGVYNSLVSENSAMFNQLQGLSSAFTYYNTHFLEHMALVLIFECGSKSCWSWTHLWIAALMKQLGPSFNLKDHFIHH